MPTNSSTYVYMKEISARRNYNPPMNAIAPIIKLFVEFTGANNLNNIQIT